MPKTFTEVPLNFEAPVDQISCASDKHVFMMASGEKTGGRCLCEAYDEIPEMKEGSLLRVRTFVVVYGTFAEVPLTVNQDEPYFVREWDAPQEA